MDDRAKRDYLGGSIADSPLVPERWLGEPTTAPLGSSLVGGLLPKSHVGQVVFCIVAGIYGTAAVGMAAVFVGLVLASAIGNLEGV